MMYMFRDFYVVCIFISWYKGPTFESIMLYRHCMNLSAWSHLLYPVPEILIHSFLQFCLEKYWNFYKKKSRVTSIYPSLFKGVPFSLFLLSLIFMTTHLFLRTLSTASKYFNKCFLVVKLLFFYFVCPFVRQTVILWGKYDFLSCYLR